MPQSPVGRRQALAITLGAAAASALPSPADAADHPARPRQITAYADSLHPGGFLLANHYTEGRLLKIPLHDPAAISAVPLDSPIIGSDGIALRANGSLLAVCNHLAVAAGQEACVEIRPANARWTGTVSVRRTAWPVPIPTDIALTPYGGYVVSGRADVLFGGGTANDFVLQRL
ncbi:hypothetical protein ABZY57_20895 [Streptomyces sp. NPDC006450]|uniref:hypothetical protein n=1 Tax=Streptomyces sp. NPDC006450 TaxID=3155458 RepID=UPI0033AD9685